MITALNIEDNTRRGFKRLLSPLRRNRIRVEHKYCDCAAVKSVTYELRRGRVNRSALDRFVKGERGRVLCPEELGSDELSRVGLSGYRRFCSGELDRRLCENAALWLLREAGERPVNAVLIDPSGDSAQLCSYIFDHTDRLKVVTDNTEFYLREADRLLEERGAALRICSSAARLFDADLIIAPEPPAQAVGCCADAVALFGSRPKCAAGAPVIYTYRFELPEKLARIKPAYLEDGYFAGALYTLAGVHSLGSSVFTRCSDGVTVHTRGSLREKLKKRLDSHWGVMSEELGVRIFDK